MFQHRPTANYPDLSRRNPVLPLACGSHFSNTNVPFSVRDTHDGMFAVHTILGVMACLKVCVDSPFNSIVNSDYGPLVAAVSALRSSTSARHSACVRACIRACVGARVYRANASTLSMKPGVSSPA